MTGLFSNFKINLNENLFLIDPLSSNLGKSIIINAVDLIYINGYERFTFRKLGEIIYSPEASIYRYFKSKNQLLSYLVSFYWRWMDYQLVFATINIQSPLVKLQKAIDLITKNNIEDSIDGIELKKLKSIIVKESSKSIFIREIKSTHVEEAFKNYKIFVSNLSLLIREINPKYKFSNVLISTIIEGAHMQFFFLDHMPELTNQQKSDNFINTFYKSLAIESIKNKS